MTLGVTDTKLGTMPKADEQAIASLTDKGKTPTVAEVSPEAPKLYTQKDVDAFVHTIKSEAGREKKALETEVVSLKKQVQSKEDELTDNASEIEKLQEKIDNLASDDPNRFNAVKELKAAQEERRQLKADRRALEVEKETHGEAVKLAQDTLREISIWEMSAEYENGDPVRLKDLCDTFEAKSEEQIRKVADTLWTKKAAEPIEPSLLHPFKSETVGGGEKTEQQRLKERYPTMG